MLKLTQFLLMIIATLVATPSLHAQILPDECHRKNESCTSLSPDVRLFLAPCNLTSCTAYSLMGEVGVRNYRVNGTLGLELDCRQRVKVTGEYLTQKLRYGFSSGRSDRWVQQYAVGGAYEYYLGHQWLTNIEGSVFYSHAFNRSLSTQICSSSFVQRHIAGGRDVGCAFGGNFSPWCGSKISLYGNYDHIIYHRKYSSDRTIAGVGGTIGLYQKISDTIDCDFTAEFRRPFNYYFGLLNWSPCLDYLNGVKIGVFGSYTAGKSRLPSSTCAGIQICFEFGGYNDDCCYSDEFCNAPRCCNPCERRSLCDWVTEPAVFMPQVLAIADQNLILDPCLSGGAPTSTTIPPQFFSGVYSFDVSPFFFVPPGEAPLVYSSVGLPAGSAIDPTTGIISGTSPDDGSTHTVTVTGANACGSTSQTFTITYGSA